MSFDRKFSITYGLAKKLREEGSLDLLGNEVAKELAEALYDWDRVGRAVAVLLGEDAEEVLDNLEPADLAKAREALREAVINFIQATRPETMASMEKILEKQAKVQAQASQAVIDYLDGDEIDKKVRSLTDELLSNVSAN